MDGDKLLTVAVPAYNVEKTLPATLDSLLQARRPERLDVVVVDDGSTDGTPAAAEEYSRRFPGVVRVVHQPNGGHGAAVNTGLDEARGVYFRVVDGDDRVEKAAFDLLLDALAGTAADLVATPYRKVPAGSPGFAAGAGTPVPFEGVEYGRLYRFDELPLGGRLYFGIHSSAFRTALLRGAGVRLQRHTFYVDAELCLLPIPSVKTVLFVDACVYLYTVGRAGQSIDFSTFVKRYDDHLRVVKRLVAFAAGADCAPAQRFYMQNALAKLCFTHYMLGAFYDDDRARGRRRARAFDGWLRAASPGLYRALGGSAYIRFCRATGFRLLPGRTLKSAASAVYHRLKPLFGGKRRFTY